MEYTNKAKVIKNKRDFYVLEDINYCYIIESADELSRGDIIAWDETGTFFYNISESEEIDAIMQYDGISRYSALATLNRIA